MEVRLLNVQSPFPMHISRFLSRDQTMTHHRDQGAKALRGAIALFEAAGVSYRCHTEIGEKAKTIAQFAKRHRCDLVVMGTSRQNSFTRFVQDSVTNGVMELAEIPVEVIPGEQPTRLERFGIPAGIGIGLTLWYLASE